MSGGQQEMLKRRVPDEHDEEYDRGKVKKVRSNKNERLLGPGKERFLQAQHAGDGGSADASQKLTTGARRRGGAPWKAARGSKGNWGSSCRVRGGRGSGKPAHRGRGGRRR